MVKNADGSQADDSDSQASSGQVSTSDVETLKEKEADKWMYKTARNVILPDTKMACYQCVLYLVLVIGTVVASYWNNSMFSSEVGIGTSSVEFFNSTISVFEFGPASEKEEQWSQEAKLVYDHVDLSHPKPSSNGILLITKATYFHPAKRNEKCGDPMLDCETDTECKDKKSIFGPVFEVCAEGKCQIKASCPVMLPQSHRKMKFLQRWNMRINVTMAFAIANRFEKNYEEVGNTGNTEGHNFWKLGNLLHMVGIDEKELVEEAMDKGAIITGTISMFCYNLLMKSEWCTQSWDWFRSDEEQGYQILVSEEQKPVFIPELGETTQTTRQVKQLTGIRINVLTKGIYYKLSYANIFTLLGSLEGVIEIVSMILIWFVEEVHPDAVKISTISKFSLDRKERWDDYVVTRIRKILRQLGYI